MTFFLSDRTTAAVPAPAVALTPDREASHPVSRHHSGSVRVRDAAHPHRTLGNQRLRRLAACVLPGTDLPVGLRVALACCGLHSSLRVDGWGSPVERLERGAVADQREVASAVQRGSARRGLVVLGSCRLRDLGRRPRLVTVDDTSSLRRLIDRVRRPA